MSRFYDFIIVGSGASGSVIAHYLTKAGANVLMLEAGHRYEASTFPSNEMEANSQLMWNGGMDPSKDASTVFIRGKAVGGSTIINNCLLDRFDDNALDEWLSVSELSFFNQTDLGNHYDEVESHLSLHQMSQKDWNKNAELYAKGFDNCGFKWASLRRGQSQCGDNNDCMMCLGGCPRKSKQSMLETFIPNAEKQGLTLQSNFAVHEVVHGKHFVCVAGSSQGQQHSYYANKVILACGALGTTELLLKSELQKKLPALGKNFFCHPQWMTIALFDEIIDSHKGSFQTLKSSDTRFREQGIKLENVFAGPIAVSLLKPGYGLEHQRFMQQYRNMACIEVAVRDQGPGTIRLNNRGRLIIDKPLSDSDRQKANLGNALVTDIFHSLDAKEVITSPLQIGLHLMGGCSIGSNAKNSVVNESFQVHNMPNLYIADSSIFPSAPGINPSLTIMAMSHRASQSLLAEYGENTASSTQPKVVA